MLQFEFFVNLIRMSDGIMLRHRKSKCLKNLNEPGSIISACICSSEDETPVKPPKWPPPGKHAHPKKVAWVHPWGWVVQNESPESKVGLL